MAAELIRRFRQSIKEAPMSEEVSHERIHPLDELDESTWLTSGERVTEQNAMIDRVAAKSDVLEYAKGNEHFPHDVVGAELFVRKLETDPKKYVVGAVCVTESHVPAINFTPSIMYFHPKRVDEWGKLTQVERAKRFRENVLPNIERVVIIVPGWGNELLAQEPKSLELLSGGLAVDLVRSGDVPTSSDLNQRTVVLNMATMGANHSLDIPNKGELTDLGILMQIYEAIDRVGQQVMQAKVESLLNDPKRAGAKIDAIDQVLKSISKNKFRTDPKAFVALNRWFEYVREERELIEGTWWRERQAVIDAHSMGANKILDLDAANYLKPNPALMDYRQELDRPVNIVRERWAQALQDMNIDIEEKLRRLAGVHEVPSEEYLALYDFLLDQFKIIPREAVKGDDLGGKESSIGILPHVGIVAEMAVVFGPGVDKDDVNGKYGWILEKEDGLKITPETALAQVALLTDILSILVKLPIQLTRWNKDRFRKVLMGAVAKVRIVGAVLASKIGRNAFGFSDAFAAHWDSKMNQADFIDTCSRILTGMTPLASENTLTHASPERIDRLVKKTRIIVGEQDKTVRPLLIKLLGANLIGKIPNYVESIVRVLPKSGHYVSEEEFPQVKKEIYQFLIQHGEERGEVIQLVLKAIYRMFTDEKFENVTLIP